MQSNLLLCISVNRALWCVCLHICGPCNLMCVFADLWAMQSDTCVCGYVNRAVCVCRSVDQAIWCVFAGQRAMQSDMCVCGSVNHAVWCVCLQICEPCNLCVFADLVTVQSDVCFHICESCSLCASTYLWTIQSDMCVCKSVNHAIWCVFADLWTVQSVCLQICEPCSLMCVCRYVNHAVWCGFADLWTMQSDVGLQICEPCNLMWVCRSMNHVICVCFRICEPCNLCVCRSVNHAVCVCLWICERCKLMCVFAYLWTLQSNVPRREARDVLCRTPVWNLGAYLWFTFPLLLFLPSPLALSDLSSSC